MDPQPPSPDHAALIERYRAARDAALEAEAALLSARAALTAADRRTAELDADAAASAYGEASIGAQAADRAVKRAAVALADALLASTDAKNEDRASPW